MVNSSILFDVVIITYIQITVNKKAFAFVFEHWVVNLVFLNENQIRTIEKYQYMLYNKLGKFNLQIK